MTDAVSGIFWEEGAGRPGPISFRFATMLLAVVWCIVTPPIPFEDLLLLVSEPSWSGLGDFSAWNASIPPGNDKALLTELLPIKDPSLSRGVLVDMEPGRE